MSLRQDLIAELKGVRSRRQEGSSVIYENLNIWHVTDYQLLLIKPLFSAANDEFSELFYNVDSDVFLKWSLSLDGFVEISTGNLYLSTSFNEDFEGGVLPAGWTVVDGGENDWEVGTAAFASGSNGLYISNDAGVSNVYSSVGLGLDVSHVYVDIDLPAAASNELVLEFDWRCEAEVGFDFGSVFKTLTSFNPVANVENPGVDQIGQSEYNNQSVFVKERIDLPLVDAGTTKRFIWSWRNDISVQNQPPMAIDNVKILFS